MKTTLYLIHKSKDTYINEGFKEYENRLKHYIKLECKTIELNKKIKFSSQSQQKDEEGRLLLQQIEKSDVLILLDEKGKLFTSVDFADQIQKWQNASMQNLIFVIGGPFGFSDEVYQRADFKIGLSKMTLTHQMVRLFFLEQLYRAHTILKGEKYHH